MTEAKRWWQDKYSNRRCHGNHWAFLSLIKAWQDWTFRGAGVGGGGAIYLFVGRARRHPPQTLTNPQRWAPTQILRLLDWRRLLPTRPPHSQGWCVAPPKILSPPSSRCNSYNLFTLTTKTLPRGQKLRRTTKVLWTLSWNSAIDKKIWIHQVDKTSRNQQICSKKLGHCYKKIPNFFSHLLF